MNCPECGRECPACPDTGYNADDLCRDCFIMSARTGENAPENAGPVPGLPQGSQDDKKGENPAPTPFFEPPPTRERRVVVQWPNGEWQIIGYTDKQPADIMGSVIAHNLIACRRSYYLYRPLASPSETMKNFHANQQ